MQRVNHWLTAALFTLLALSGLAMFSPYLFFLTGLFGGGQSTRAVHPWLGVALILSFGVLFVRFVAAEHPEPGRRALAAAHRRHRAQPA